MDKASLRHWFAFLVINYTDTQVQKEHRDFKKVVNYVRTYTTDARRIINWVKLDRHECNEHLKWIDNFVSEVEQEHNLQSAARRRGRGRGRGLQIAADCLENLHDRLSELELLCPYVLD